MAVQSGQRDWFTFHYACGMNQVRGGSTAPLQTTRFTQNFAFAIPRYGAEIYFPYGPPSSLWLSFLWLHILSNHFLEFHPTCKGAALEELRQLADVNRFWQIVGGYPNQQSVFLYQSDIRPIFVAFLRGFLLSKFFETEL